MRRPPARRRATPGELVAAVGVALYGLVALGWITLGPGFLVAMAIFGGLAALAARAATRANRRRLARQRRARRGARLASHRALWAEQGEDLDRAA